MANTSNDRRLTETELAKRWDVTPRTLQNWRADGNGPAFISIGKNTIRYRLEDVLAYEEARKSGGDK